MGLGRQGHAIVAGRLIGAGLVASLIFRRPAPPRAAFGYGRQVRRLSPQLSLSSTVHLDASPTVERMATTALPACLATIRASAGTPSRASALALS